MKENIIIALIIGGYISIFLTIKKNNKTMSDKLDEIMQIIGQINDSANNIAADLERIANGIPEGGLSEEEAAGVVAELQDLATRLKTLADVNPDPVPPTV